MCRRVSCDTHRVSNSGTGLHSVTQGTRAASFLTPPHLTLTLLHSATLPIPHRYTHTLHTHTLTLHTLTLRTYTTCTYTAHVHDVHTIHIHLRKHLHAVHLNRLHSTTRISDSGLHTQDFVDVRRVTTVAHLANKIHSLTGATVLSTSSASQDVHVTSREMCTCVHAFLRTYVYTRMYVGMDMHYIQSYIYIHTYIRTYIHTHPHTSTHNIHAYIYMHCLHDM